MNCPCGFSGAGFVDSVERARAHREMHLAAFPDLDARSRANLDSLVAWAEERDEGQA